MFYYKHTDSVVSGKQCFVCEKKKSKNVLKLHVDGGSLQICDECAERMGLKEIGISVLEKYDNPTMNVNMSSKEKEIMYEMMDIMERSRVHVDGKVVYRDIEFGGFSDGEDDEE
jgi:ribosome-binding protein aMBF1 (putative translation factor)